ncbi:MAG: hypothetical protein AAF698_08540 [Pseudomonadota bacterium]
MTARVTCEDGRLRLEGPALSHVVEARDVIRVLDCRMADPIAHGEEEFHILEGRERFVLIGLFAYGGLGAVEAFCRAHPAIPVVERWVEHIPWRYRERGRIGLRLFPIAGTMTGPIGDLPRFRISEDG